MAKQSIQKLTEYDQQALDFLESTGTTFEIEYQYTGPYFAGDTVNRDVYRFTLKNSKGEYSANFGDSIHNTERRTFANRPYSAYNDTGEVLKLGFKLVYERPRADQMKYWRNYKPSAYDVLAGLQGYEPPATFEDFCSEYGYDDQPLASCPDVMKIYRAVQTEYRALRKMYSDDELEQLAEIA